MTQYDPQRIKEIKEVLKAKKHDSVIYSSRLEEDCKYLLEVVEEQRKELTSWKNTMPCERFVLTWTEKRHEHGTASKRNPRHFSGELVELVE